MSNKTPKQPKEDDVLRRMLQTPPKPHDKNPVPVKKGKKS